MRKVISLLAFILMLTPVCAFAGQEVPLPNSRYMIEVPDWMDYNDPVDGAAGVEAYISADLEMDYISYPTATAAETTSRTVLPVLASLRAFVPKVLV